MSSVSVEAAKNSCVPQEQNELVVQTGLTFQIPKLKFEDLFGNGNTIYLIGDFNKMAHLSIKLQLLPKKYPNGERKSSGLRPIGSILDISQENRSKGIIICFDEPSYNGRQCLYHLFGGDIKELSQSKGKPYQAFSELIDRVQDENTCGIVFVPKALQSDTLKPVMWCPATVEEPKKADEPKFPRADVESIYMNRDKQVSIRNGSTIYPVNNLPESMKLWIKANYPETEYVNFGPSHASKNGMVFSFWGWNQEPANYTPDGYSWRTTFESVKEECVNDSIQVPESEWNDYLVSCNYDIFNVNNPKHYTDPKKLPPTLKRWMESHPSVQYVVWSPNDDNTLTIKGLDRVDYKDVSKWNRKVKIIKNTAPSTQDSMASLDSLVDKSLNLTTLSKLFYKLAKTLGDYSPDEAGL